MVDERFIAESLTDKCAEFTCLYSRLVVHMASKMSHGADVKCAGTTEVSCQLRRTQMVKTLHFHAFDSLAACEVLLDGRVRRLGKLH